jgi:hypothetical protein
MPAEYHRFSIAPRVRVSILFGLAAAGYVALVFFLQPRDASPDFDLWWVAAQAWRVGQDPYQVVQHQGWKWPLYYPFTMVLAVAPTAWWPRVVARSVVMGVGAGLLAWTIQRTGRSLWLLASGAFLVTLYVAQAGAWIVAATAIPWLGFVWTCKPTIGLAVGLPYCRRGHLLSAALFLVLSLAVFPEWPVRWLEAIRGAPDVVSPLTRPGGFLLLLALLRWRHREAWLLLALAAVPHTTLIHETLPLALIPRGKRESQVFAATTLLATAAQGTAPTTSWPAYLAYNWWFVLGLGYLPTLVMLLRRSYGRQGEAR